MPNQTPAHQASKRIDVPLVVEGNDHVQDAIDSTPRPDEGRDLDFETDVPGFSDDSAK